MKKDKDKTKEQLLAELTELRQRMMGLAATETARQRAEEALQESEEFQRALFEGSAARQRVEKVLRQRNQALTALNDIITSIASTLELDQVLQEIVKSVAELLPHISGATIQMLDETTGNLVTRASTPKLDIPISQRLSFHVGEGIAGWAIKERRLVNIPDVTAEPRFVPNPYAPPFSLPYSSLLVVPLLFGTQTLGTLSLESAKPAAFGADDEWLTQLLARSAAIAIANARLVAALREREAQLRDYNLNLEQLVEERTAALRVAQQQLIHSEKLASLGRLAASVVHEVSNPLTVISSYLNILEEKTPSSHPDRKMVEAMLESVGNLSTLLRQLRSFARPPVHKRIPISVNTSVEQVLTLASEKLSRSKVQTVRDLNPELSPIQASPSQLEQVFLNLVINAVDAMPDGGTLTVRTRRRDNWVYIDFADTGMGIMSEHLDHIFEPFFTTKGEKGTGLGLAISHRLVEEHGGNIQVESQRGVGTTVTVELPAAKQASHYIAV